MSCVSFILSIVPPVFTLLLTVWSYYSYVIAFCIDYIVNNTVKKATYLTVFHLFFIMFLWSYIATMFQNHAPVPQEYKLLPEEHEKLISFTDDQVNHILKKLVHMRQLEIYMSTNNGGVRYCKACLHIKPDRTHHCSTCEKCILKMDHHCPWVYNCVGYSNYKQFMLTLFYGSCLSLFYGATLGEILPKFWSKYPPGRTQLIDLFVGFIIGVVAFIFIFLLFVYHIRLIVFNETTLEAMRDVIFCDRRHSFNCGCRRNFLEVFGNNCCLWLIPVASSLGNGYEFDVRV